MNGMVGVAEVVRKLVDSRVGSFILSYWFEMISHFLLVLLKERRSKAFINSPPCRTHWEEIGLGSFC